MFVEKPARADFSPAPAGRHVLWTPGRGAFFPMPPRWGWGWFLGLRLYNHAAPNGARPCGTGLGDCCVALLLLGVMASWRAIAAEGPIPPLRPVRGELVPGFWELYGGWFVLGMALLAAATVAALRYHRRKNPAIATPPDVLARQALEILRDRTEDVALVTEVSRLLRQYLVAAFGLPPEELTITELQQALRSRRPVIPGAASPAHEPADRSAGFQAGFSDCHTSKTDLEVGAPVQGPNAPAQQTEAAPELATKLIAFLRQCDERKFAPAAAAAPLNAVERALGLIRQVEAQRRPITPPGVEAAPPAPAAARP